MGLGTLTPSSLSRLGYAAAWGEGGGDVQIAFTLTDAAFCHETGSPLLYNDVKQDKVLSYCKGA